MPTTIYDASQITYRNMNKAQSGDFINRTLNSNQPGYAPRLGVYDQSIINSVMSGQMRYYRRGASGVTTVNNGCPCVPLTDANSTN